MAEALAPSPDPRALQEQIRILQFENDRLAERAEDSLLLGLIAEKINALETATEVVETGLEQVSILKDIPFCFCGRRDGGTLRVLHAYLSTSNEALRSVSLPIPAGHAEGEAILLDAAEVAKTGLAIETSGSRTIPTAALYLPGHSRSLAECLFLFAVSADSGHLSAHQAMLTRAVEMIAVRLDLLTLVRELRNLNRDLDRKVAERTRELRETNLALEQEIAARQQAMHALRASEERYRGVFEGSAQGIVLADPTSRRFLCANPAMRRMFGYTEAELTRLGVDDLHPADSLDLVRSEFEALARAEKTLVRGLACQRNDGSVFYADIQAMPMVIGDRAVLAGFFSDLTERLSLEDALRQAQKLESVGRLAGGVAHDFNNMLSVILGRVELALMDTATDNRLRSSLLEIQRAAQRSADLTRQLLAFARKQTVTPRILDVNAVVDGTLKMLERLIGEDIELRWQPGDNLWPVRIDPVQVDQLLANLCINARDAIAGAGTLRIETHNAVFDETYCLHHPGVAPGEYVHLALSDTGCGMAPDVLDHIFEPFFTTKGIGKGTGLGLATVYGIVKQNNGFVNVDSTPGRGSTFHIYLPRYAQNATPAARLVQEPRAERGHETILVVEDEPALLAMSRVMLEPLGYQVLTAVTPGQAVQLAEEHAGTIHLLVTDVIMPEMNGRELARRLLALYPEIRTLFMSGYTADIIACHGVLDAGVRFLQKPFTLQSLTEKIREALA